MGVLTDDLLAGVGAVYVSVTSVAVTWIVHSYTGKAAICRPCLGLRDSPDRLHPESDASMFTDPISLTISGAAKSLPRVSVEGSKSVYSTDTGDYTLNVSHVKGKRRRSVFRIDQNKTAADPFNTERNLPVNQAAYLVLDTPLNGTFTNAEQKAIIDALADALKANTGALTTKFVAGES